jgi:hypothetical protein
MCRAGGFTVDIEGEPFTFVTHNDQMPLAFLAKRRPKRASVFRPKKAPAFV